VLGWSAAAAAAGVALLAAVGVARARRSYQNARVERCVGEHQPFGPYDLVTLPTAEPLALSLAGVTSQIVVSRGLVEALPPEEMAAVLRHEAAHLRHLHQRWLLLATALEHALGFLPPIRTSTGALRVALERWADEEAAGESGHERVVLRRALLRAARALVSPALAAFSAPDTVLERLQALNSPRTGPSRSRRAVVYAPGLALGIVVLVAFGAWAGEARTLIAMAGRCLT
jgi:Zn-dependent protease with chaperone function